MKFYNFETMFRTLADELSAYLKSEGIYYERSGMNPGYHFEIKLNPEQVSTVNAWLDANTITEVK